MTPFIVYAMPRSRSYWLSRFLTYGPWVCGHDEARHVRSLDDVKSWFTQPYTGTVETAAAPFWRLLSEMRTVVLWRPVPEVVASLERFGFDPAVTEPAMRRYERKLEQIYARIPDALWVESADLGTPEGASYVFRHCLQQPFDEDWWYNMNAINHQTSLLGSMRYLQCHLPQLSKVAAIAKHRMLADMQPHETAPFDGMEVAQESFATWRRDGTKLFEDHCVLVGEEPSAWSVKNIPLMQSLDEMGALQITTARCNGRMFGYLMTVVTPSLEAEGRTIATNTTFYASPDVPRLGMKLQRSSLDALRKRGVDEVYWATRERGAGERVAALYRRLGAKYHGQWLRLDL